MSTHGLLKDAWKQVPIEETLERLGSVRKRNKRFTCPECDPSAQRSAEVAIKDHRAKCFKGCGLSGDSADVVQFVQRCNFQDAIKWLTDGSAFTPQRDWVRPKPRKREAAWDVSAAFRIAEQSHPKLSANYLERRWKNPELARRAAGSAECGWKPPTDYYGGPIYDVEELRRECFDGFRFLIALRDTDGKVRSLVRRWSFPSDPWKGKKTLQLSADIKGDDCGPLLFGSLPRETSEAKGGTLHLVEGEVDFLLIQALRDRGDLKGGVLGVPGANQIPNVVAEIADRIEPGTIKTFSLLFDQDKASNKGAVEAIRLLSGMGGIHLPDLPHDADPTDVIHDQGEKNLLDRLARASAERFELIYRKLVCSYLDEGAEAEDATRAVRDINRNSGRPIVEGRVQLLTWGMVGAHKPTNDKKPPEPPTPREWDEPTFMPVDELQRRTKETLFELMRERNPKAKKPAPVVIAPGVGSGKTTAAREALVYGAGLGLSMVFSQPRHELLDETQSYLEAAEVIVLRTPDIRKDCAQWDVPEWREELEECNAKRLNKRTSVCSRKQCPHLQDCTYHRKLDDLGSGPGTVVLTTHKLLGTSWVLGLVKDSDVILVDEDPLQELLRIEDWNPDQLLGLDHWLRTVRYECHRTGMSQDQRMQERILFDDARHKLAPIAHELAHGRKMSDEWHHEVKTKGWRESLEEGKKLLREHLSHMISNAGPKDPSIPTNLLSQLVQIATSLPRRYGFSIDHNGNFKGVLVKLRDGWAKGHGTKARLIILDGTADPDTYRAALKRKVEFKLVGATPLPMQESQTLWVPRSGNGYPQSWSRSSFKRTKDDEGNLTPCPVRLGMAQMEVSRIVDSETQRLGRVPTVNLISHKFMLKPLGDFLKGKVPEVRTRHFSNLTGTNDLEEADLQIVFGVPRPDGEAYSRSSLLIGKDPSMLDLRLEEVREEFLGETVRYHRIAGEAEGCYWREVGQELVQAWGRARNHLFPTRTFLVSSHPAPLPGLQVWDKARSTDGQILKAIQDSPGGLSPTDVATACNLKYRTVLAHLPKLARWGRLQKVGKTYCLPTDLGNYGEESQAERGFGDLMREVSRDKSGQNWRRDGDLLLVKATWSKIDHLKAFRKEWHRDGFLVKSGSKLTAVSRMGGEPCRVMKLRVPIDWIPPTQKAKTPRNTVCNTLQAKTTSAYIYREQGHVVSPQKVLHPPFQDVLGFQVVTPPPDPVDQDDDPDQESEAMRLYRSGELDQEVGP